MVVLQMNKIDVGAFGEAYTLTIGNIEKPKIKSVQITITECEFEKLKPLFSHETKSGKFGEHSEFI